MAQGPAVERSLGLMCGAGELPALMAGEARRHGWRVIAFAFDPATRAAELAARVVPCRIHEMAPVLAALREERVSAVVLSGKFWMGDLLRAERTDAAHARMAAEAGGLLDSNVRAVLISTLAAMDIELLDQRSFLGDALPAEGVLGARGPREAEWQDIRRGLAVARAVAGLSVGQTVVVRRGAVSAVEAIEGTTAAVRRGTALAGPGAVVVKATSRDHDFRFDVPAIGTETVEAAADGGAAAIAFEAGRVFVLDRLATARRADAAGIALVSTGVDEV